MGLFKSELSPIEQAVINATDENLTKEDWSKIIAVLDEVNAKPAKNASLAIDALRKRLNMQNGNVQLFSLTLLNALAQNCGPTVQREIASSTMTSCLSSLGTNSNTHRTVLVRLIEILDQLKDRFQSDPTLAQISMVHERILKTHPRLAAKVASESQSPSREKSVPTTKKKAPTPVEDDDDDEDLRRALELSLRDIEQPHAEIEAASHRSAEPKQRVKALYDFTASEAGELSFRTGDIIEVVDRVYKEWWKGVLNDREGIFPVNYVESIVAPGSESQQPQPETVSIVSQSSEILPTQIDEDFIFAQIPAVEKLLTILASASQSGDGGSIITNQDIQQLYHRIASMRPRLIQLIEEYTMKKEELIDLNQKMLQARRSYEGLMADAASRTHFSPAQTPQHSATIPIHPQGTGTSHVSHPSQTFPGPQTPQTPQSQVPSYTGQSQSPGFLQAQTASYPHTSLPPTMQYSQTAPAPNPPHPQTLPSHTASYPPPHSSQTSSYPQTLPSHFSASYPSSTPSAQPLGQPPGQANPQASSQYSQHLGMHPVQSESQQSSALPQNVNSNPHASQGYYLPYPDGGSPYSNGVASRPY